MNVKNAPKEQLFYAKSLLEREIEEHKDDIRLAESELHDIETELEERARGE